MKIVWSRRPIQFAAGLALALLVLLSASFAQWIPLGPNGGDVRSLTSDPRDPSRIFLGTSASQLYESTDNGKTWSRLAHLGGRDDYVLDNIRVDPRSGALYVAGWTADMASAGGELFRSRDEGKTWQALPGMHNRSIRALQLAPSDTSIIVAGALDGVFRSHDGGENWERISPLHDTQIKNVESVAIDPQHPDVIYAGTWHLAWKTVDGGRVWRPMKNGVIDDSDVFSIVVDQGNNRNVYLSACSGIYKSENRGGVFSKVQGIPFSARRTRVLMQDPLNPAVVYAGTTEGLWRTRDAGKTWRRIMASIIVNAIHIDPRDTRHILLATDRGGVLASSDGGGTFVASNRGFSHRMVRSILVDRQDVHTFYAGVVNDKEFGGVFVSHDDGRSWRQSNRGIHDLDVFTLAQTGNGDLLAGTNKGIFRMIRDGQWQSINAVVSEVETKAPARKPLSMVRSTTLQASESFHSELSTRVRHIAISGRRWFAATDAGLYGSVDEGKTWHSRELLGKRNFQAVRAFGTAMLAVTAKAVLVSKDGGEKWSVVQLPPFVTSVYDGAVTPADVLWVATKEGIIRSQDDGDSWERTAVTRCVKSISYDDESRKLMAISDVGRLFISADDGKSWQMQDAGYSIHASAVAGGRVLAATAFSGVVIQPATEYHPLPGK